MAQNTLVNACLTFSLIDSHSSRPAAGVRYQVYWSEDRGDVLLRAGATDDHGTTSTPAIDSTKLSAGVYKIVLHMGDYYESIGIGEARHFIDLLPVVFIVSDASKRTHVEISTSLDSYTVKRVVQ